MEDYNAKKEQFMNDLFEHQFLFEITKCCGYSVWIPVYKNMMLSSLYENVKTHFEICKEKMILSVFNEEGHKLVIPTTVTTVTTVKEFIRTKKSFFKPVYPFPSKIIYKMWLDDSGCVGCEKCCILHSKI